jgi:integrase
MWRVHVEPDIGSLQLEQLTPEIVAGLYDRLRKKGSSATVIHRVGVTMQRAIMVATKRGIFFRANPFALVDRPTPRPKEMGEMTPDDARRFIAAARSDRLGALFILLITSGLRLGEALGLQWDDIDFENRRLSIRRSLTEVGGFVELGPTKTRGSRRPVEIGKLALAALEKRLIATQGEAHDSQLVFTTSIGTPLRRSNLRRSHFKQILARAKVDGITIHGLRHAMTSFGIAGGVSPKVLAERLGHSTTRLTQDPHVSG